MKILLINHYAGSQKYGMEFRPYYFAKKWVDLGNDVTIMGASFSHLRSIQPKIECNFQEEKIDGINYIWVKTPKYKGNGIKRFVNMLIFVASLLLKAKSIAKKVEPNVVIASSTYPLDIFPAKLIAKKTGAKLIFEIHDLWPLSPMILGKMPKYHPFIMLIQLAENFACKWSDKVVSILPLAKEYLVEHGMDDGKFFHIPNGVVVEDWMNAEDIPELHKRKIERLKREGKFLICYAGAHGLANALESFVRAAKLIKNPQIHLILVGDGLEKQNLIKIANQENLVNITFLPPVPKRAIPNLLKEMDVLFFSLQKCSLFKYGISPNKLIDYMMAKKPIISAVEAGNDIVKEAGCGLTVEPENIMEYVKSIEELFKISEKERILMGEKGREYVLKNNNINDLATKVFKEMER